MKAEDILKIATEFAPLATALLLPVIAWAARRALRALRVEVKASDRELIKGATKGAYLVFSRLSSSTENKWDDLVAFVLGRVGEELGRALDEQEQETVKSHVVSLIADPRYPSPVLDNAREMKNYVGLLGKKTKAGS